MGLSAKQIQALRRNLDGRQVRTREANGREISYIEGWFAISEANRIFGFDGWSRETIDSRCVLARENRGTFVAVYVAKVRITVQASGAMVVREGHGSGEGRGNSPGEVHDIALKAAETDASKRAFATFGKPFGLELYRQGRTSGNLQPSKSAVDAAAATRFGFHPDDTTPIPRPSHYYGRRQNPLNKQLSAQPISPAPATRSEYILAQQDRQKHSCLTRTQTAARQTPSPFCGFPAVPRLRSPSERPAPSPICATARTRSQSQRRVHHPALPRSSPRASSDGR